MAAVSPKTPGHARTASINKYIYLVLFISVALPFLGRLGSFPEVDEGSYIFVAHMYENALKLNSPLISFQGFSFYPLLLSWLFELPGMTMIWFRLADMCVSICAGYLFCLILIKESGHRWFGLFLAFVFLCAMTQYSVVEAGFKNSIFAAWLCLFGAYYLTTKEKIENHTWYIIGILVALGVLLRETFFPFAFLGFFAIWKTFGFKNVCRYSLGGIFTAIIFLVVLYLLHPENIENIFDGYSQRVLIYTSQAERRLPYFFKYAYLAIFKFIGPFLVSIAVIFYAIFIKLPLKDKVNKLFFWLIAMLIPLWEPLAKIGFTYHFACCLPGLAGFIALISSKINFLAVYPSLKGSLLAICLCLGAFAIAAFFSLALLPGVGTIKNTIKVLSMFPSKDWPQELVSKTNTLLLGEKLKLILPPDGTLSTSGLTHYVYNTTGYMPPLNGYFDRDDLYRLSDLNRSFLMMGKSRERMDMALKRNGPDAIALGYAPTPHDIDFYKELTEIIKNTGLYEEYCDIPVNTEENGNLIYKGLGYKVFKKKNIKN